MMLVERCLYKVATNAILEQCMFSKRLQSNIAPGISSSDSVTVLLAISNIDCMSQPALYVCEIKSICEPPPALQYTC